MAVFLTTCSVLNVVAFHVYTLGPEQQQNVALAPGDEMQGVLVNYSRNIETSDWTVTDHPSRLLRENLGGSGGTLNHLVVAVNVRVDATTTDREMIIMGSTELERSLSATTANGSSTSDVPPDASGG